MYIFTNKKVRIKLKFLVVFLITKKLEDNYSYSPASFFSKSSPQKYEKAI